VILKICSFDISFVPKKEWANKLLKRNSGWNMVGTIIRDKTESDPYQILSSIICFAEMSSSIFRRCNSTVHHKSCRSTCVLLQYSSVNIVDPRVYLVYPGPRSRLTWGLVRCLTLSNTRVTLRWFYVYIRSLPEIAELIRLIIQVSTDWTLLPST
jgi:hypothetical protein